MDYISFIQTFYINHTFLEDIDSMAEKITLNNLGDFLGLESISEDEQFIPEKDQKYEIVSIIAYMIGVWHENFADGRNFEESVFKRLEHNKNARIIRNLSIIRSALVMRGGRMFFEWKNNAKTVLGSSEFIPSDVVSTLAKDGVRLSQKSTMTPLDYLVEVNKLISDRINNCKQILPDWIRWDYVKDLFIMKNGKTTSEVKTELDGIKEYAIRYPFQRYINWNFGEHDGNILKNDKKFCVLLYEKNFDIFSEYNKVTDVSKKIKGNIYEFLASGSKIDMVVDCENSDVYNIISMLQSLEWNHLEKINKMILVDDVHTNLGWQELKECTDIPIKHIMVDRLLEQKSRVDGMVIARICQECYKEGVKSFVLLSSDSDFWTVIDSLKGDAEFLVMVERIKCSHDYKTVLADAGVLCCYLDDFNSSGGSEKLRNDILLKYIDAALEKQQFNLEDIFRESLKILRINMDDVNRKQFFEKQLRTLQMNIDENGNVKFERKKK